MAELNTGPSTSRRLRIALLSLSSICGNVWALEVLSRSGSSGVAIRLADQIIIAADGLGVYEDANGPISTTTHCKVVWTNQVAFVHTGLAEDKATGFEILAVAHSAITRVLPLSKKVNVFRDAMLLALQKSMERARKDEPERYKRQYLDKRIIDTAFAAFENGSPILHSLVFNVNEDHGRVIVSTKQIVCPGDCATGPARLFLGESDAMAHLEATNYKTVYDNVVQGVKSLNQAEIDDPKMKNHVGPPISVLVITSAGEKWIDPGACKAGW